MGKVLEFTLRLFLDPWMRQGWTAAYGAPISPDTPEITPPGGPPATQETP